MHPSPPNPVSYLSWSHVGLGLVLVAFNSAISQILRLRIGTALRRGGYPAAHVSCEETMGRRGDSTYVLPCTGTFFPCVTVR